MIITVAQLKARIGKTASDDDVIIASMLTNVSAQIARACGRVTQEGRPCLERTTLVEAHNVDFQQTYLCTRARPIVSITGIIEALYGAFTDASATTLTQGEDFHVEASQGVLHRVGLWLPGRQTVQVTYVGGYNVASDWVSGTSYVSGNQVAYNGAIWQCKLAVSGSTAPADDASHWTLQSTEWPIPEDLREAAYLQAGHCYDRKGSVGSNSQSVQGGSVSYTGQYKMLDEVERICASYRRLM